VSTVNSRGSTLRGSSQHWAELHTATNDGLFNPAKDSTVAGSPRLPLWVWVLGFQECYVEESLKEHM